MAWATSDQLGHVVEGNSSNEWLSSVRVLFRHGPPWTVKGTPANVRGALAGAVVERDSGLLEVRCRGADHRHQSWHGARRQAQLQLPQACERARRRSGLRLRHA